MLGSSHRKGTEDFPNRNPHMQFETACFQSYPVVMPAMVIGISFITDNAFRKRYYIRCFIANETKRDSVGTIFQLMWNKSSKQCATYVVYLAPSFPGQLYCACALAASNPVVKVTKYRSREKDRDSIMLRRDIIFGRARHGKF